MAKITEHEILRFPEVTGIFTGGCIARGEGSSFRAKAHSHTDNPFMGWICVRSAKRLTDRMLMLHEAAHIITGLGHVDSWRKKLLEIGGTLDATDSMKSYHKKRRTVNDTFVQ